MVSTPPVNELRDVAAIKQLKHRYGYHLDRKNWKDWGSLFTEDGTIFVSAGRIEGRDAIVSYGKTSLSERYDATLHMFHNPIIEVDDDQATGHWTLEAFLTRNENVAGLQYGRYDESYRHTDSGWQIARLEIDVLAETGDDLKYTEEFDERRDANLRRIHLHSKV